METKSSIKDYSEVYFISLILFSIETTYFKTAIFIHDYISALLTISYALAGLGIGALIGYKLKNLSFKLMTTLKITIIISIILSFINFTQFPEYIFFSPFLLTPFIIGNTIITYYLKTYNTGKIYFFDLIGAACGVILSVILIPLVNIENFFFLPVFIIIVSFIPYSEDKPGFIKLIAASSLIFLAFIAYNISDDTLNLARITRCTSGLNQRKIFCIKNKKLIYTGDSNVQRIDAFYVSNSQTANPIDNNAVIVTYDGIPNDGITPWGYQYFRYDPRVLYGLIKKPKFLVIGASAEGVVKTAASHEGKVIGLEINNSIRKLMTGKMYNFSQKAYDLLKELHIMDARTYLEYTNNKFDIITLMNSHLTENTGSVSSAEFLHTYEAVKLMLKKLTKNGMIMFEERISGQQSKLSTYKVINTVLKAMKDSGIRNPKKNIYIYKWTSVDLPKLYGSNKFCMIVIKKSQFAEDDFTLIANWKKHVENNVTVRHKVEEIFPTDKIKTGLSKNIVRLIKTFPNIKKLKNIDLSIITDNRPYPWAVYKNFPITTRYLLITVIISIILLGIIIFYWFKNIKVKAKLFSFSMFFYFAFIGIAYFIIEIGLMNFYQMYTGSPTNSFIFILAALLLSSGAGSYFSNKFSDKIKTLSLGLIIAFALYHLFLNKYLISAINSTPLINSIFISITVLPLGFFMGIPFPLGMDKIKEKTFENNTPFYFAVNSVFSMFSVVLGFYLSIKLGFKLSFFAGLIFYTFASVIFILTAKTKKKFVE